MRDRNQIDWNVWMDTYKEGFRAFEAFARFNYAVAGDVLEAGFAQAKATLGARAGFGTQGTQALAELLEKQAELGTQLSEKIRERAQEFSSLAAEVQDSVGSFASAAASRTRGNGRSHSRKSA
jgi:hypothetical protein